MDQIETYVIILAIIIIVGIAFKNSSIPTALLLVMTGMVVSFFPNAPKIILKPELVLDVFLPLLIYTTSAETSWKDMRKNIRPIALLSVGHIFFITGLVAVTIHALIPELGWPMAFVLGSVVSPPDDVAIVPIAEKLKIPQRLTTILKGEGMFNDAAALILFRFSLLAVVTHEFAFNDAISTFFLILVGETLYGLVLGFLIGELRLKVTDPSLQMMISLLTPFLAYLPAERLGGCGVLATVVAGSVIGQRYVDRLPPESRLLARSVWSIISFLLQSILFLLVGLDLRYIVERITNIPINDLFLYGSVVILAVVVGRFIWVFPAAYIPRWLFPSIRKRDPYPPWQYPFIISWAGMRGGISLAAAFAVPLLPTVTVEGVNPRDFILFLVFCVIFATLLLQGLSFPWILKKLGVYLQGKVEDYQEHLGELRARLKMTKAVLHWLSGYSGTCSDDPELSEEVKFRIQEYKILKKRLLTSIKNHKLNRVKDNIHGDMIELRESISLSSQIIEVERKELTRLWREEKVSHSLRNKLQQQLDYRYRHIIG